MLSTLKGSGGKAELLVRPLPSELEALELVLKSLKLHARRVLRCEGDCNADK